LFLDAEEANLKAEEAARRQRSQPQPVKRMDEAERAALYAALDAARKEMMRAEEPVSLPQVPADPEPEPAEPATPLPAPPAAAPPPSPAPLVNPFFSVDPPFFSIGW
jgi:hypothetical protein